MHEIERKFLILVPGVQIERSAVADGSIVSRRLIQQRYLGPAGWRLRAKATTGPNGIVRTISLKRRLAARIDFTVDAEAWSRLEQVATVGRAKIGDAPETLRLRMDDLSGWTIRIRRSTGIAGNDVRCYFAMKRKVTMMKCVEIESDVPVAQHDLAVPFFGPAVRKRRVCIAHGGRKWELDVFLNAELHGIEFVEVELPCESIVPRLPSWVGREVTEEREYKNAKLVRRIAA
jgi:CYTH domain-containing protein